MLNHATLRPRHSSRTKAKRLGRGVGSGKGVFCGRGCKGQKARTGKKIHPLFEWGQSPLHLRLPKLRGGAYATSKQYSPVNLADLQKLADAGMSEITLEALQKAGYVRGKAPLIKVLPKGKLTSSITIHAHAASTSAKTAIEKAGGTLSIL